MKQINWEKGVEMLICAGVCYTIVYLNISTEQGHLMVAPGLSFAGMKENMQTKSNVSNLMYWTNDSVYDDITCKSDMNITSCKYSKIHVLRIDHSTGIIEIAIYTYDKYNRKKTNGGDIIVMSATKLPSGGKAPGHVTDHMNGSYYGRVQVRWSGMTKITVKLVSAKENQCLRFKAMDTYGNSVFALTTPYCIHYRFVNNSVEEFTRCGPIGFIYGYETLCNFTNLNYGYSWYCGKPIKPGLGCNDYAKFQVKPLNVQKIVPNQNTDELIHVKGHCIFPESSAIVIKANQQNTDVSRPSVKCSERYKEESWTEPRPTGYSIKTKWKFYDCLYNYRYIAKNLIKCLKGKRVAFIGDSTVRQYFDVLAGAMRMRVQSDDFSKKAYSKRKNIHLTWRKHEMPFYNRELFEQERVRSTKFQIDELANDETLSGNSTILVVHYGSHLQAFPPSVYRSRVRELAKSLRRLLEKKPGVAIFVKGAAPIIEDTHWFDVRISLIFNEILFEEFADLQTQVTYLDVFSIFVANNVNQLHPFGQTLKNQVQQLLAYIC